VKATRSSLDGQGVLGAFPVDHEADSAALRPPAIPLPLPPVEVAIDASLLGNLAASSRKSTATIATPSRGALISNDPPASSHTQPSPPPPPPHVFGDSRAQPTNGAAEQAAAASHHVPSPPSAAPAPSNGREFDAAAASAVGGPKALQPEEESQRLLVKAKLEAQHIQRMRLIGDLAASEASPLAALENAMSHDANSVQSTLDFTGPAHSFESKTVRQFAQQLLNMEQTLRQERLSSQSQIQQLQRQLHESKLLHQSSVEQQSHLLNEHMQSIELISDLRKQIEENNNSRAQHQVQTSDLITGISSSLEARTQELQNQVQALAAGSDRRKQEAVIARDELQSLRTCLALATDHAQAALRAKAKGLGRDREPMHMCLWERSCGWYLKDSSGEQQGPLDLTVLEKIAPKSTTSCWCEGFKQWLPYDKAMKVIKRTSPGSAGKDDLEFDAVQYHIAQVCFLHSRASDSLERSSVLYCKHASPASASPAHSSVEFINPPVQQLQGYPSEVLESMWFTVSKRT
jgi:hypothetical protein